jgi:RNA polymerase sigma-70 factor (ECF subfamily)
VERRLRSLHPPLAAAWPRRVGTISGESALEAERERAFAAFVAAHRDRAVGMAWRLVGGDAAAAEDVAQEAFARAHRALGRFREEAKLSTWFYRILVNEAQRHRRWRWVRERFGGAMPEDPPDPSPAASGDPALRARVARALMRLPRGQREAFVLVHLEGLSLREAAEVTGRATGTLKSHLHRALRSLRMQLADLDPRLETTR